MRSRNLRLLLIGVITLTAAQASAYRINYTTGALSDLVSFQIGLDRSMCHPERFDGEVVKREFGGDAISPASFIVEAADGQREFINAPDVPANLNLADRGWIVQGMQKFTRVGRAVHGTAQRCGASGHFLYLDSIR
jgi:hypothetical protein